MTTKEQERAALRKVREIVDGLGEDSYVAAAFDGCFETAEENIANDFATSPRDRLEAAYADVERWRSECAKQSEEVARLKAQVGALEDKVDVAQEMTASWIKECHKARRDMLLETVSGETVDGPCGRIVFHRAKDEHGFPFVVVTDAETGWVTSYKLEDIRILEIS